MATRDEQINSLLGCLHEIKDLMEYSYATAMNQQRSLVDNDAEGIVVATKAQEEVLRRIGEADQRAAAVSRQLAIEANAMFRDNCPEAYDAEHLPLSPPFSMLRDNRPEAYDADGVDASSIAQIAGSPHAQMITAATKEISTLAAMVADANETNRVLLQNGLDIVTECLRAVATTPATVYSDAGLVPESRADVLSLDRKV